AERVFASAAEELVGFAERELARATEARGASEPTDAGHVVGGPHPGPSASSAPASAPTPSARELREAREARAREELARMKADLAAKRGSGGSG
ncbi:MAG: hypothetical protein ABMB14_26645, partial [Myxococcota bacterium]